MTQITNRDIEKNVQYIFTQYKIINDQVNTLINVALLNMHWRWAMTSYLCSILFAKSYTDYRPRETMTMK